MNPWNKSTNWHREQTDVVFLMCRWTVSGQYANNTQTRRIPKTTPVQDFGDFIGYLRKINHVNYINVLKSDWMTETHFPKGNLCDPVTSRFIKSGGQA